MGNVIPKLVKYDIIARWCAPPTGVETTWMVALFTTNQCLTQTLYTGCTGEVLDSAPGYDTGGVVLSGRAANYDGDNAYLTATNSQWTLATFTAAYAVVYETATNKIRVIYDFGGNKTVTTGTFTIQWSPSGLIKIS